MLKIFNVKKTEEAKRLDLFLTDNTSDFSRSFIQKSVKRGDCKVNGKKIKKTSYSVSEGDVVKCILGRKSDSLDEEKKLKAVDLKLNYICREKDYVVVNKPSGLIVHAGVGSSDNLLVNGIFHDYPQFGEVGNYPSFGLVHRLDKETSGVILAALSDKALWQLSKQFEERLVTKYYITIVSRGVVNQIGRKGRKIENYIGRSPGNRRKMAVVKPDRGRFAATYFHLIAEREDYALVLANLKTGRTHQIRVHLSHLGFPVIGDSIYGGTSYERMMLHAYKLCFFENGLDERCFTAKVPNEFVSLFEGVNIEEDIKDLISMVEKENDK